MQLTSITLALACATSLMASPFTAPNTTAVNVTAVVNAVETLAEEFIELHREKVSSGFLIYLGPGNGTETTKTTQSTPSKVAERAYCPSGTSVPPKCSTNRAARNGNCDSLVTELGGDSFVSIVSGTKSICYTGSESKNDQCCVSWHSAISGLTKGDVVGYANTMLQTCTESGISGKIRQVSVGGTCTNICLCDQAASCT